MTISKELLLVLEQGYSAGGEPELAQQLAKALRIKGKLNALLKIIEDDLIQIWLALEVSSGDGISGKSEYKMYPDEPLKYAINCLMTNEPMVLKLKASCLQRDGISAMFKVANRARKFLAKKLNALSVRIQYGGESEYFLVEASNISNL